jgi:hypothetical protein
MQKVISVRAHNIAARITHGIIGFDLQLNGNKDNPYMRDFLTLNEKDISTALEETTINRCFAPSNIHVKEDSGQIIESVKKAQWAVKEKQLEPQEIKEIIDDLSEKVELLYSNM